MSVSGSGRQGYRGRRKFDIMVSGLIDPGIFKGAAGLDHREIKGGALFQRGSKGAAEGELVEEGSGQAAAGPGNLGHALGDLGSVVDEWRLVWAGDRIYGPAGLGHGFDVVEAFGNLHAHTRR